MTGPGAEEEMLEYGGDLGPLGDYNKKPAVRKAPEVPANICYAPMEGSRVTRLRPTNEHGEPTNGEPLAVRWCGTLGAFVRA
jgi:hypothetical protein